MVTEDGLIILVKRIETLAAAKEVTQRDNLRLERERDDLRARLMTCQEGNRRNERDLKEAHAKVKEWANYGAHLRGMLKHRKVLEEKLPVPPKVLETAIPF